MNTKTWPSGPERYSFSVAWFGECYDEAVMEPARGFIALISAVVISAILMGVAATLDQGVFFTRFDGLNFEYHRIAERLADSCIEAGLLKLADNYDYLVENDSAYDGARSDVPLALGTLYGEPVGCLLTAPTTTPPTSLHTRNYLVVGEASFNGAFVTKEATVTVTDPHYATGSSDPYIGSSRWLEIP